MRAGLAVSALALLMAMAPQAAWAKPKPMNAVDAMNQVAKAERDFDAYTHVHGYAQGFYKYSAPGAINFHPEPFAVHEQLAEDLKADPSDKPSKLRWAPYWIGMAGSRDMAWDLGPWWIEGTDKGGWFFTVWQKQADGDWLWVLDGGAGPDTPGNLPQGGNTAVSYNIGVSPTPETSPAEAAGFDDRFNGALGTQSAPAAYVALGMSLPELVAGDSGPPATQQSGAKSQAARNAMLATRPTGLVWTRDGLGSSSGGDMVYTYGRASAADGAFMGHYVRIWHKLSNDATAWVLTADIYQAVE